MSEHTPGPWYVGAQNDILHVIDRPARPSNDDANPDREVTVIAKLYQVPGGHAAETANADLLAAAPDLLAACEDAIQFIRNGIEFGYIRQPDPAHPEGKTLPGLVAAVKKAKGES